MPLELNKLFTFVPSAKTETFKTAHCGDSITSTDPFYGKICFLAGTGEIITRGKLFAINKLADLADLKTLVGNSLTNTGADTLNVSTIIDFIQEVYTISTTNRTAIGDSNSGLVKELDDLETRVGLDDTTGLSKRIKDNESAITLLNKTDGTVGSVKKTVDDAISALVASAPSSFDTLKEIADWIGTSAGSTTASEMLGSINILKNKVGIEAVAAQAAEYYTQEEADAYNTANNLQSGDADYKTTESIKTPAVEAVSSTGIYASIDDLQSQINVISGGGSGSIQSQITSNINLLDSSVTLAGTTSEQPSTVNKVTYIDVLGSVTISETDGKVDQIANGKSAKIVLSADAAGAAKAAYDDLLGTNQDATTDMTLYGIKAYAANIVANKNVSASGDSLVSASANGNAVTVASTQALQTAVGNANTALQSVTLTSTNTTYLTVSNTTGVGDGTAASGSFTPVMGVLTNNGIKVTKGTNGIASTDVVADIINGMDFWEEYTD